ncbi:MAG: FHA domain-containing protein [Verrucomicrobiae bacterium]|nr:FHA domain-containing protein [Verrucomicrobiae bacterium]
MRLRLTEFDNPAQAITVARFPSIVGSAADCSLTFKDARLSTHHAVFIQEGNQILLIDLESRNGTYVIQPNAANNASPAVCPAAPNPDDIPPRICEQAPVIQTGTTIAFGGLIFTCELDTESSISDTEPPEQEMNTVKQDVEHRSDINQKKQCEVPRLVVTNGTDKGRSVRLSRSHVILGSNIQQADIPFPSNLISRRHAKLSCDARGHFFVEDLGSKNGTYVNGKRIIERQRLKPGVPVSLGHGITFHVRDDKLRRKRLAVYWMAGIMMIVFLILLSSLLLQSDRAMNVIPAENSEMQKRTTEQIEDENIQDQTTEPIPSPILSEDERILIDTEKGIQSAASWEKEKLALLQNRLNMVREVRLTSRRENLRQKIKNRILSLQSLDIAYWAISAGLFNQAVEQFVMAAKYDHDNVWAENDLIILDDIRSELQLIEAESTYETMDENKMADIIARIEQAKARGTMAEAIHGYIDRMTRRKISSYYIQAQQMREKGRSIEALEALRRLLKLAPWNQQGQKLLTELKEQAEPELANMLILAYQLESRTDVVSRQRADDLYAKILELSSPLDWTAELHRKAAMRSTQ